MSLPSVYTDPNFFGKDSYVPFIGQVESVDDPKRSGRVKVRCLGWHPVEKDGDNGLATEDLPWARTCMPVTHPQQMRAGGKHGLIPGSMVVGFFADGNDANDPFVLASFNFTAKASEENNREDVEIEEGKIPDDIPGFKKINPITEPNTGLNTKEEIQSGEDDKGDIAHDTSALDDTTDGECPIKRSAFTDTKEEEKTASNPHSQNYNTKIGDGLCGNLMNGRANISDAISSMLPSGVTRFVDGDDIFDINGNVINLNGILNKLSGIISSDLKDSIQKKKAFTQKTVNKIAHSTGIFAAASRSPLTAQLADQVLSTQFDMFNSLIDRSLDQLQGLVMQSLQNINNDGKSSKGPSNATGEYGTSRPTEILDLDPINIADSVINDIDVAHNNKVKESETECEEYVRELKEKLESFQEKIDTTFLDDYECEEDMNDDINSAYDQIVEDINNSSSGSGSGSGGGGFDLGEPSKFLEMALNMDFTLFPTLFNKSGLAVLDTFTQEGCNPYDMYHTISGYAGSMAGIDSMNTGGGSESGKSSKRDKDIYKNSGFAGKPGLADESKTTYRGQPGNTKRKKMGQSVRKSIRDRSPRFRPVDYYEVGRVYELRGEQIINGEETDSSRVLVNNQADATENGIYVTSKGDWRRSNDADIPTNFTRKKRVVVRAIDGNDGIYFYSGKQNPKVGYDEIHFESLFVSEEFNQEEKDAFDYYVDSVPDGSNGSIAIVSRPSSDKDAALNFVFGIPNTIVVTKPGKNYYFRSKVMGRHFPSIVIRGYVGTPVPVVDPNSGELVAVLANYNSFGKEPDPASSIISDDSSIGISTEDPTYDVVVAGFYVSNTGVGYDKDTTIQIIDKDRDFETAIAKPRISKGRITSVEIINNGTGFKRIPKVKINGKGKGCKLYPIMGLKVKEINPSAKKLQQNVALSISPSPTNTNLFSTIDTSKL